MRPWTPLVTDPIGTSSTGTDGKSCWNISRLVWPWSFDTPLDMLASRRPMTAILNGALVGLPGARGPGP